MKKVLFATTALVATAGVAAADVTISGAAEMGIVGGSRLMVGTDAGFVAGNTINTETQFHQDIEVTFGLSGETDNGLTFGASIQLDEAAWTNSNDDGGTTVFISGNFGTLTMGDTDGALDWALTEAGNVGNPGSINDAETTHVGYMGSYLDGMYDGQIVRYDYAFGDFAFAVSVELDDTGVQNDGMAVGIQYGMNLGGADLNLGLGYQSATTTNARFAPGNTATIVDLLNGGDGVDSATAGDATRNVGVVAAGTDVDVLGLSVGVTLDSGFSAGIQYSDWDFAGAPTNVTHTGIGLGYAMNGLSVHFNYGMYDLGGVIGDFSGYGIAVGYDLGGASLLVGYGVSDYDVPGVSNTESFSLGLSMGF